MRRWVARETGVFRDRSMVGFWPLAETFYDVGGLGNHGLVRSTAAGCPASWSTWQTNWNASTFPWNCDPNAVGRPLATVRGRPGLATNIGASFLECGFAPADLDLLARMASGRKAFSVSFWFCSNDVNATGGLVTQSIGFTGSPKGRWQGWQVRYDSGVVTFEVAVDSNASPVNGYLSVQATPDGKGLRWTHCAAVCRWDGSKYVSELYFDGRPARPVTGVGSLTVAPNPTTRPSLLVGAARSSGQSTTTVANDTYTVPNATVSLVRAYRRALNPVDVAAIHRREKNAVRWKPTRVRDVAWSSGVTLAVVGNGSLSATPTLFVEGGGPANFFPLYLCQTGPATNTASLFLFGTDFSNGYRFPTAILATPDSTAGNIVPGYNPYAPTTAQCSLFIRGIGYPNSNADIDPPQLQLNVGGYGKASAGTTLFVGLTPTRRLNLFVKGPTPVQASSVAKLFTRGRSATPELFGGLSLVTNGAGGPHAAMNLFLKVPNSGGTTRNMNLSVEGSYGATAGGAPLFLKGGSTSWWPESDAVPLFLLGTPVGQVETGFNLTLKAAEGGVTPLFLLGPPGSETGAMTLIVGGAFVSPPGALTLVVPAAVDAAAAGQRLYTHGF